MVALGGLGAAERLVVVANDGRRSGERLEEAQRILRELGLRELPLFFIPHSPAVRRSQREGKVPLLREAGALVDFLL